MSRLTSAQHAELVEVAKGARCPAQLRRLIRTGWPQWRTYPTADIAKLVLLDEMSSVIQTLTARSGVSKADAEDIHSECVCCVLEAIESYSVGQGAFRSWVWTKLTYLLKDLAVSNEFGGLSARTVRRRLAKDKPLPTVVSLDELTDEDDEVLRILNEPLTSFEAHDQLHDAIERLPPEQRFVIGTRYFLARDGRPISVAHVAEVLGLTPSQARYQHQAAMENLRRLLKG